MGKEDKKKAAAATPVPEEAAPVEEEAPAFHFGEGPAPSSAVESLADVFKTVPGLKPVAVEDAEEDEAEEEASDAGGEEETEEGDSDEGGDDEDEDDDPDKIEEDIESALDEIDKEASRLEGGGAIRSKALAAALRSITRAVDGVYTLASLEPDGAAPSGEDEPEALQLEAGEKGFSFSREEIEGIQGTINGAFSVLFALHSVYGEQLTKFLRSLPLPKGTKPTDPGPGVILAQQIEQCLLMLRQCHDGIADRTGVTIFDVMRSQGVPEEQIKALQAQLSNAAQAPQRPARRKA